MKKYIVEPGTMLYDNGRIGWVVGKHQWTSDLKITYSRIGSSEISDDDDWDIEWSDGRKEYYGAGTLTIFIINFLNLQKENGK